MSVERRGSRLSWRRVLSPVVILATVLISGCGGGGGGGSSLPQTITLSVVPSARSASLGWSPIPATPTTYNVYVDGQKVGSLLGATGFSPSFIVSSLAPSSSHCAEVRSQSATGDAVENARSNEVCFSTLPTPVRGLELAGVGADALALRWSVDADDPGVTEIRVVRSDGMTRTLEPTARSFDDVGLVPQTEYCYEIRTANARRDVSAPESACLASGWRNLTVATAATGQALGSPALAIDAGGTPAVAYIEGAAPASAGDLWLARLAADTWTKQRIAVGALNPSLAIDTSGGVHVAYIDSASGELRYANDAGGFAATTVAKAATSTRPSLVVDAAARAHIAYDAGDVGYATNRSGNWSAVRVSAGMIDGFDPLALGAGGRPHLTYSSPTHDLQIAVELADGWSITTVSQATGGFCGNSSPSLALAPDGTPHVSAAQNCHANAGALHGVRGASGSWQFELLPMTELAFRVGWTAIAVDRDAHVHVTSAPNLFNRVRLKYWTNAAGAWKGYTLSSTPTSTAPIRIDAAGQRHVAYWRSEEIVYATTRF